MSHLHINELIGVLKLQQEQLSRGAATAGGLASITFTIGETPGSIDILATAGDADDSISCDALIRLIPVFKDTEISGDGLIGGFYLICRAS